MPIDWTKIEHPIHEFRPFASRRSTVYGTKGMVACSQPLAAEAGLEILRRGGNAADAAVAISAALNVTEPSSCGIGGDAFCLYYDASSQEVCGLNGSGRAPKKISIDIVRDSGVHGSNIPATSMHSVTVPGAAAAWVDVVESFGSGVVSFADIMTPAILLAEEGVPVSELHSHAWQRAEELIKNASPNYRAMLLNGKAPQPGEIMTFPDLARTFQALVHRGKDGFYSGYVAQAIVDLVSKGGGVMELSDLADHSSTLVQPVSYTYQGDITLYECPPNGQGLTALMTLGILEALENLGRIAPILSMEHNSAEYAHAIIEALRLSFADTQFYVTDPELVNIPVDQLLSQDYLHRRAELFDPHQASQKIQHGYPLHTSDTVQFSVTDKWGNGCSFVQSNYAGFGTGAIPEGCGFTLQNRGSGFNLTPGHPNQLMGGKRPYHTIMPAIATHGKDLFLVYGVMGGFMQPQGHVQVLLNILRGYTPQAALDAPRFCILPPLPDSEPPTSQTGEINATIFVDSDFSDSTIISLQKLGHNIQKVWRFGHSTLGRGQIIQSIQKNPQIWAAGSDPRSDGHAIAQI
ncbi:gamma-glutamyltranspeptidase [Cantharellus anzutake]|uniref:gamma-glutamyltranspeptidase n=1 Tax=Cantharellus anzutake TaxID=1750568 RepID=UPI0019086018|nr:gamma-glutamyltranspeptidase [Cantharellus anzutake]KAF8335010.1 gamma-glutamyltranspeptidase [Cantharellus anzutake]